MSLLSVSILTHPEGRVLHKLIDRWYSKYMFQSSPIPKDGCYTWDEITMGHPIGVSILTHPEGRVLQLHIASPHHTAIVSILTHPEGRVLLDPELELADKIHVSILTHPEGRVLLKSIGHLFDKLLSFNPHPSRRTGATCMVR